MSMLTMELPGDILESARMTLHEARVELAVALFAGARLSMGKAAELAELSVGEFQLHLGARRIGPHYDAQDAAADRATLASLRQ